MGRDVSTSQAWVAGVEGCTSHCERVGWEQGGHTKALWAQEGHRRPSEVPRAIPHQNGQNSRQILKSAPTHTRTYVHTHTHAHTHSTGGLYLQAPTLWGREGWCLGSSAGRTPPLSADRERAGAWPD